MCKNLKLADRAQCAPPRTRSGGAGFPRVLRPSLSLSYFPAQSHREAWGSAKEACPWMRRGLLSREPSLAAAHAALGPFACF